MRISDWSSDVCSSDLCEGAGSAVRRGTIVWTAKICPPHLVHWFRPFSRLPVAGHDPISISIDPRFAGKAANRHRVVRGRRRVMQDQSAASWRAVRHPRSSAPASDAATPPIGGARTEEHTYELPSLMRITDAGFIL